MQRRRCTYTQNSFLAFRTLVVHFPLRGASVTAGPWSLFQDQRSFLHWPVTPEHGFPGPVPRKEPRFRWAQVEPGICIIKNDPGSSVEHSGMGPAWQHQTSSTLQPCLLPSRTGSHHTAGNRRGSLREGSGPTAHPGCRRASHGQTPEDGGARVCWGQGPTLRAWEASWQKEVMDPQGTR